MHDTIKQLEKTILQRRSAGAKDSYVRKLAQLGRRKMAQKLGEEGVEAVIAAVADDRAEMIGESADLIFHLLVVLADMGISWADICAELDRREGVSGLAEKAARNAI